MTTTDSLEDLARTIQELHLEGIRRSYPSLMDMPEILLRNHTVHVKPATKYTKIDIGGAGRFMVVNETGEIYGIKGYGVIHRGHFYGTLETPNLPKIEKACY